MEGVAIDDDSATQAEHVRRRVQDVGLDVLLEFVQVEGQHRRGLCIAVGRGEGNLWSWPYRVRAIHDVGLVDEIKWTSRVDEPRSHAWSGRRGRSRSPRRRSRWYERGPCWRNRDGAFRILREVNGADVGLVELVTFSSRPCPKNEVFGS